MTTGWSLEYAASLTPYQLRAVFSGSKPEAKTGGGVIQGSTLKSLFDGEALKAQAVKRKTSTK